MSFQCTILSVDILGLDYKNIKDICQVDSQQYGCASSASDVNYGDVTCATRTFASFNVVSEVLFKTVFYKVIIYLVVLLQTLVSLFCMTNAMKLM